jgi:putative ABC transport system permease protein
MDLQKLNEQSQYVFFEAGHHLKTKDLLKLSVRVFKVRPLRTFLTILGISLGIGTVLFLVSLGYGLQYILIGKLASTEDSLISLDAYYPGERGLVIDTKKIEEIIALPETDEISPVGEFSGEIKIDSLSGFVVAKIIKPSYFRLSGLKPDFGSIFTEGERSVVISNTALRLLGMEENEKSLNKKISINVTYQDENGINIKTSEIPETLNIKGIVADDMQPPFVFVPSDIIPDKPPFYHRLFIKSKGIDNVDILKDELIGKGFLISARIDLVNQAKKIMTAITVMLGIFGVAALIISAIGMFNTMVIGFLERIFEIGIMKSLGASVQDIRNLFLMESLIMGLLGGIGGITVGVLGGEIFNLGLNFLAGRLGGKPISLFIYPPQFLAFIVAISAMVGVLSGFWPARRAANLSPKQAFIRK